MDDAEIYEGLTTLAELALMVRDNRNISSDPRAQSFYDNLFPEEGYVN
jgi:hypothetical protein